MHYTTRFIVLSLHDVLSLASPTVAPVETYSSADLSVPDEDLSVLDEDPSVPDEDPFVPNEVKSLKCK